MPSSFFFSTLRIEARALAVLARLASQTAAATPCLPLPCAKLQAGFYVGAEGLCSSPHAVLGSLTSPAHTVILAKQ